MPRVRIVTDSGAGFVDPDIIAAHEVEVLPLQVRFDDLTLRDGTQLDAEEMFHRQQHKDAIPEVSAPSMAEFEEVYQRLAAETNEIVVVTHSKDFTPTFANAQSARGRFLGRCEITVLDSMTLSVGQGFLVEGIAEAAASGATIEDVVRIARGIIPRLYSVLYVDTLDYIQRAGLIAKTQSILGDMLEIKPLLTIEDGQLMTMEKVRTHSQAVDRVMEFVTEFTAIERLCILQNTSHTTDRTRMLQDRLALEFSRTNHPIHLYEPLLAALIGPEGMGISLLEGDTDLNA